MKQNQIFPHIVTLALFLLVVPAFAQIAGIGLSKSDNQFFFWYNTGTVIHRPGYRINGSPAYSAEFNLPAGKSANDIVGMSFSSVDKVYTWYADGTRSVGPNYKDLGSSQSLSNFSLPPGKSTSDIVGIAINSDDKVFAWYSDYTVSAGTSRDLNSVLETTRYSLPAGKLPSNIIEMEFDLNNHLITWFLDGTVLSGAYQNLGYYTQLAALEASNQVADPAGNRYDKIRLANLTWTKQNMNYTTPSGSWCYDDNPANCQVYGRLYTWDAARLACESLGEGWRLPTHNDWHALLEVWSTRHLAYKALILGGSSGFDARLGGLQFPNQAGREMGSYGHYWSGTENNVGDAWLYVFDGPREVIASTNFFKYTRGTCRCVHE